MRLLELFSGTGSVGKVFGETCEVVSDIEPKFKPKILVNVLEWNYKEYPVGHFDLIWASPPCTTFSSAKFTNIGRNGLTRERCEQDIVEQGLPLLAKTLEIICYFKPAIWAIENPRDGRMKRYLGDLPYSDCAYCQYGFPYRKRTRIWNNIGLRLDGCQCKGRHPMSMAMTANLSRSQKYVIPPALVRSVYRQVVDRIAEAVL